MKNLKFYAAAAVFALMSVSGLQAQSEKKCDWREKMMSEKIAFITAELELTPQEAQAFWPVYDSIENRKQESQKAVMTSYMKLFKAVEEGKASDREIENLLDAYLEARQADKESEEEDADRFRKVLPERKVAKLYVAEEKFRRHHIRSMKAPQHHPRQEEKPQAKR